MSGECDKCGERTFECFCKREHITVTIKDLKLTKYVPEQQWISVKDRLPSNYQEILVWGKNLRSPVSMIYRTDGFSNHFINSIIGSWDEITHWMPLPKPPEKKYLTG